MIHADQVTRYDAEMEWLEEAALFWIAVAGKGADQQAKKLDELLKGITCRCLKAASPFEKIRHAVENGDLHEHLQRVRIGQYTRIGRAFSELACSQLDLRSCTVEELEAIPGIGPKTARCFLIHTRPDVRVAGLDTHILKYLAAWGIENVPRVTPGSKREYHRLEQAFLKLWERRGQSLTVAEFDLLIWSYYAGRLTPDQARNFEGGFLPMRRVA